MKKIATDLAPKAIGPYSQAIINDGIIYVSGQIPFDVASNEMITDPALATMTILKNISGILKSVNASLSDILKTTIYLTDINDFKAVNSEYEKYFKDPYPARTTVAVAKLPKDAVMEMDVIARIPKKKIMPL